MTWNKTSRCYVLWCYMIIQVEFHYAANLVHWWTSLMVSVRSTVRCFMALSIGRVMRLNDKLKASDTWTSNVLAVLQSCMYQQGLPAVDVLCLRAKLWRNSCCLRLSAYSYSICSLWWRHTDVSLAGVSLIALLTLTAPGPPSLLSFLSCT